MHMLLIRVMFMGMMTSGLDVEAGNMDIMVQVDVISLLIDLMNHTGAIQGKKPQALACLLRIISKEPNMIKMKQDPKI